MCKKRLPMTREKIGIDRQRRKTERRRARTHRTGSTEDRNNDGLLLLGLLLRRLLLKNLRRLSSEDIRRLSVVWRYTGRGAGAGEHVIGTRELRTLVVHRRRRWRGRGNRRRTSRLASTSTAATSGADLAEVVGGELDLALRCHHVLSTSCDHKHRRLASNWRFYVCVCLGTQCL